MLTTLPNMSTTRKVTGCSGLLSATSTMKQEVFLFVSKAFHLNSENLAPTLLGSVIHLSSVSRVPSKKLFAKFCRGNTLRMKM